MIFRVRDAGGTKVALTINSANFMQIADELDLVIGATDKIFLDGLSTGNTSIRESVADEITFEIGGIDCLVLTNIAHTFKRSGGQLSIIYKELIYHQ